MEYTPWNDDQIAPNGKTVSENFAAWFGDSKAVDHHGKPTRLYHCSNTDIEEFCTDGRGKTSDTGAFFADDSRVAATYAKATDGAVTYPVYLSMQRPLIVDACGKNWNAIDEDAYIELDDGCQESLVDVMGVRHDVCLYGEGISTDDIARFARTKGYDGLIVRGVCDRGPNSDRAMAIETDVYVAFFPSQIKSAIGNTGLYHKNGSSITDDAEARALIRSQQAKQVIEAGPARKEMAPC